MKNLYLKNDTEITKWNEWLKSHKSSRTLSFKIIKEGIIIEPQLAQGRFGCELEVGIFDKHKKYIKGTGISEKPFLNLNIPDNSISVDENVIYCGFLTCHYGHFLLQSTTRLWYYLQNKQKFEKYKLVFSATSENIPKFIADFFELCEIDKNKIMLVTKPTKFKQIICPDISSIYYKDFTDEFALPFKIATKKINPSPYKKVFFSRKYWTGIAKCLGEEELEKIFNKNGFKSVAMEKLSLQEQIAIIKGAEILAGINGTSFHNILFSDQPKTLIMLNRNEEFDSQYIINELTNSTCYVIQAHANPLPVTHPHGPFIVGFTPTCKTFFSDFNLNNFNTVFKPRKYAKKFWNLYCNNYSNTNVYEELRLRNKEKVDINDLLNLLKLTTYSPLKKLLAYLLYKSTFGKLRKKFKQKYQMYKKYNEITFKY